MKALRIKEVFKPKSFVFILCAMRSGSTLLKSLLATADEVSHLPEVNYRKYKPFAALRLKMLSEKRIILLKKPRWPKEIDYPDIPVSSAQQIVLVRHPYELILSNEKMYREMDKKPLERAQFVQYWCATYEGLAKRLDRSDTHMVQYERLLADPKEETKRLFAAIGLPHLDGVENYKPPVDYNWEWLNDDGGEKIKSLTVQKKSQERNDQDLLKLLGSNQRVNDVLSLYGYVTTS